MLKELYHGKINCSERCVSSDITELNWKWLQLSKEFEQTLTPEQIEIYHKLSDLQCENASLDNEAVYEQGFKDGAKMIMEVLTE